VNHSNPLHLHYSGGRIGLGPLDNYKDKRCRKIWAVIKRGPVFPLWSNHNEEDEKLNI